MISQSRWAARIDSGISNFSIAVNEIIWRRLRDGYEKYGCGSGNSDSQAVRQNIVAKTTTEPQLRAIMQYHVAVAVRTGLNLANAIEIDDRRPVNAREVVLVQLLRKFGESHSDEKRSLTRVQSRVLTGRSDPVNLLSLQEQEPIALLDQQPRQAWLIMLAAGRSRRARWFGLPKHLVETLMIGLELALISQQPSSALYYFSKTRGFDRLQQVTHRVGVERPQRIVRVRCDENDRAQMRAARALEHFEAVEPRHLNVEEQQVRPQLHDLGDCSRAVTGLAH